ncbi:MAG TPA: SpoIIE family protein phosphatase [Bacteroidota bacterium]|nr:SpoIIE family protein phosphatase [Bacteroidota bacterium]
MALVFAVWTLAYSILWMVDARTIPDLSKVELGFGNDFIPVEGIYLVNQVYDDSPAEAAGMKTGDKIVKIDGHAIAGANYLDSVWRQRNPGDTVRLAVIRPGINGVVPLTAVFRLRQSLTNQEGLQQIVNEVRSSFPVPFVIVGLVVLLLRPEDLYTWLLALLFGCFIASPGLNHNFEATAAIRPFAMGYKSVFSSLLGPIFYFFFAVFPVQSPVDRRIPWLKWAALIVGLSFAIQGFTEGATMLPPPLFTMLGGELSKQITFGCVFLFIILGLLSLSLNFTRAQDGEVRRKIRMIFWGTAVGVLPILLEVAAENFFGFRAPEWLGTPIILLLFLLPLSFAYAVVRHRVLDIPVLLKRSARYLIVQRGFTFVLAAFSIGLVLIFALSLSRSLHSSVEIAPPFAIALGSVFGTVLLWGGTQVHRRVSGRIDKAFFRSAYDARQILENLAEKSASAMDRKELSLLLEDHLAEALQPRSLIIYLLAANRRLEAFSSNTPPGFAEIPLSLPLIEEITKRAVPVDFPLPGFEAAEFKELDPDCLVPMIGRGGRLVGLLVFGMRLSEEPYSREDKRLLLSVATQASAAVENMNFAEEIAERIEERRKVVNEMELSRRLLEADNDRKTKELEEARALQLSMLPRSLPEIPDVEIAVHMKTATEVGGDYYDFAVAKDGTLTIALGDATGHGAKAGTMVVAAKSLFNSFADDPSLLDILERLTTGIKRLNMHSMFMSMLLFRLKGRNASVTSAGMPCPYIFRREGNKAEKIALKGMPLGAFLDFPYEEKNLQLSCGDVVVLMSDGFPELFNDKKEMLGDDRVKEMIEGVGTKSPREIVDALSQAGDAWAGGAAQEDDMTFIVLKIKRNTSVQT